MADFITSVTSAAELRTWWDSTVPSSVPSGDRYIAEMAAGTYLMGSVSATWAGKTVPSGAEIIVRAASAARLTNVARALRGGSDGVVWQCGNSTLAFTATRTRIQGIQFTDPGGTGSVRIGAFCTLENFICQESSFSFDDVNAIARDGVVLSNQASTALYFGNPNDLENITVINFGTGPAAQQGSQCRWKNCVLVSFGSAAMGDTLGFLSGSTNNSFSAGASYGTNATTITPADEFENVSSLAAADMRLKSSSTIKTTGAASVGSGNDVYWQTRSGTPARGAIEAIAAAPVITGPTGAAGAASITQNALELQNAAGTWTATGTATWSLTGTDAAALSITGGVVTLASGNFDHETKASYSFNVVRGSASQAVTLNITNVVEISAPTRSTPTATTAAPGFTTDIATGEARCVLIAGTSPPTAPSEAQVKAGQNAAGTTSGVVACTPLAITSAGAKTFAPATVTTGLTYYPFTVHTAGGIDSAVLPGLPHYPGTGRPVSDVSAAGYTPSAGGSLSAMLNEDTAGDGTFITSPTLAGDFATGPIMALDKAYPAGTYSGFKVRKWITGGVAAEFKVVFLNDSNTPVGETAIQAQGPTPTTFTLPVTLTGTATRVQILERP